ncbi:MAG: ribonuclease HII [Candidatus Methanofastidiosa archaeon]|nr:ribonuclease HII [Candidatus Methanofastidiosa archaeon]
MDICGVDEAGRGPVIGPLVVASFSIPEERISEVESLNVKDSKKLTPKRRIELFPEILKLSNNYLFKIISSDYLNSEMKKYTLNEIELKAFIDVIIGLKNPLRRIFCDSCDVNTNRFSQNIKIGILDYHPESEVIASHKAEDKYPVVAAASILAKVKRDELIRNIEEEIGVNIGSGYPNDPKTRSFLEDYYKKNNSFPDFVRTEWKTLKSIKDSFNQTRLV